MRYIQLDQFEEKTLQEAVCNHSNVSVRTRSQALLLSHRQYPVPELSRLYQVRTRTIYDWFSRWQTQGLVGLRITQGRGRKAALQPIHLPLIADALLLDCQDLKQTSVVVSKELAMPVSKGQIKRFLKSLVIVGGVYASGSKTSKTPKNMPLKKPIC